MRRRGAGVVRHVLIVRRLIRPSSGYRRLGYDVVSRSCGSSFECSPLSCNGAAERVEVNEYCLVDDPAEPFRLAALFSRLEEGYEPGPYFVVEVWRREGGAS